MWALTALVGVIAISGVVSLMARDHHGPTVATDPNPRAEIERVLRPINARLRDHGRVDLTVDEIVTAAQHAALADGYDRQAFIDSLDEQSALTRPEVESVVRQMGSRTPIVIGAANDLRDQREHVADAGDRAGCMFIVASIALLLGLVVAVGGALLAVRELIRRRGYDLDPSLRRRDTEPGTSHTTAPYPTTTVPPDV